MGFFLFALIVWGTKEETYPLLFDQQGVDDKQEKEKDRDLRKKKKTEI